MTEKKILNCPLCGGGAFIYYSGSQFQFGEVVCKECGCRSGRKKVDETIELWNTRKPMERIVERLEERQEEACKLYAIAFNAEDRGSYDAYSDAIDIVKEEGVLNE